MCLKGRTPMFGGDKNSVFLSYFWVKTLVSSVFSKISILKQLSGWWFGTFFIFPYIGNVIIPTDELIFFRGVGIPPNQLCWEFW